MAEPMKNGLNKVAIQRLARNLGRAAPDFDQVAFVKACTKGLTKLELKERVAHISEKMREFLPADYTEALAILVAAGEQWERGKEGDPLGGFAAWPLFHFIQEYGVHDFAPSMNALRDLTHLFSAEFAVRPYIAASRKKSFGLFKKWAKHKDEHVRRLASEGCRPRLPWATQVPGLIEDPSDGLAVLELLKDDQAEYVRKSVANHLNDIAKDHPDLVIDICTRWLKGASKERRWIIERATRTLVKDGHPRVWPLLGYSPRPKVKLGEPKIAPQKLKLGGELQLSFALKSTAKSEQKLAVDYAIHFVKADGSLKPKVFKLKVLSLQPGETVKIAKKQTLKKITTRKYYSGKNEVEIFVNGQSMGKGSFTLVL